MSESKSVDIRGLIDSYEFHCKLPGTGQELKIKPITTGQMKSILAYEDETDPYIIEEALDGLITSCVVTEGFNVDELYLQDRFFLLLEIRKVTKGSAYSFNFKCPECKVDNMKSFSLDTLDVTTKSVEGNTIRVNEAVEFVVDFPTRQHQKEALLWAKSQKMTGKQRDIEVITATYAGCISNVVANGVTLDESEVSFEDKVYLLDNITSDKFDEFKMWFEDNDFGVDFELTVGCVNCDYSDTQKIPLSDFFV